MIDHWHPIAETYPNLEGQDWEEFKESIRTSEGNKETIKYRVLDNGEKQGLDGRQRYEACASVGAEPRLERVFVPDANVKTYIKDLNDHRRHQSPEQRRKVVLKLAEDGQSLRQIAGQVGVSHQQVAKDLSIVKQDEIVDVNEVDSQPSPPEEEEEIKEVKKRNGRRARRVPLSPDAFDWDKYSGSIGILMASVVKLSKMYDFHNSPQEKALGRLLEEFNKAFKHCYKLYAKIDPPSDRRGD